MLVGIGLLWRCALRAEAPLRRQTKALLRWEASLGDFLLFLWLVVAGGTLGSVGGSLAIKAKPLPPDANIAIVTAAGQLGMLLGLLIHHRFFDRGRTETANSKNFLFTGTVTFLISFPLAMATSFGWQALLQLLGIPAEKQDLIRIFHEADSTFFLGTMIVLACVGAPVVEELVFRRGIFRYARTRLPRWAALLVPAALFGALHGYLASFAPLMVLGIIFSIAYEHTGNIRTSMVAHALFNLNTILLVLAKVDV